MFSPYFHVEHLCHMHLMGNRIIKYTKVPPYEHMHFCREKRNVTFRKWGGGVKGRLELFRKFIRFGNVRRCPLFWCWWLEDGEVEVDSGVWAAMLPRVQLGASLPSIPSLLEPGQDMGSSRQGREASSTWTHNPAFSATHLLPRQAVHCIVRMPARTYSTSGTRPLCVASF